MGFDGAIKALKEGCKVSRNGWNGKNQYIQLGVVQDFCTVDGFKSHHHENINNQVIIFFGTSGTQVGWLASQADMLAEDWEIAR